MPRGITAAGRVLHPTSMDGPFLVDFWFVLAFLFYHSGQKCTDNSSKKVLMLLGTHSVHFCCTAVPDTLRLLLLVPGTWYVLGMQQ